VNEYCVSQNLNDCVNGIVHEVEYEESQSNKRKTNVTKEGDKILEAEFEKSPTWNKEKITLLSDKL